MDSPISTGWVVLAAVILGVIALSASGMASGGTGCPEHAVSKVGIRTNWILTAGGPAPSLPNTPSLVCLNDNSFFGAWLLVGGKWCKTASEETVIARVRAWEANRTNG